jgi:hypothetical protein
MDPYKGTFDEDGSLPDYVFSKFTEGAYHRLRKSQITLMRNNEIDLETLYLNYYIKELNASFYEFNPSGKTYEKWND